MDWLGAFSLKWMSWHQSFDDEVGQSFIGPDIVCIRPITIKFHVRCLASTCQKCGPDAGAAYINMYTCRCCWQRQPHPWGWPNHWCILYMYIMPVGIRTAFFYMYRRPGRCRRRRSCQLDLIWHVEARGPLPCETFFLKRRKYFFDAPLRISFKKIFWEQENRRINKMVFIILKCKDFISSVKHGCWLWDFRDDEYWSS